MSSKHRKIEVDDAMVLAAAKDINDTLKPDPLLDLDKPGEKLREDVEELFPDIVADDPLSDKTWTTLKALGIKAEPVSIAEEDVQSKKNSTVPKKSFHGSDPYERT